VLEERRRGLNPTLRYITSFVLVQGRKQHRTRFPQLASPQELALLWSQPLVCLAGAKKEFSEDVKQVILPRGSTDGTAELGARPGT